MSETLTGVKCLVINDDWHASIVVLLRGGVVRKWGMESDSDSSSVDVSEEKPSAADYLAVGAMTQAEHDTYVAAQEAKRSKESALLRQAYAERQEADSRRLYEMLKRKYEGDNP